MLDSALQMFGSYESYKEDGYYLPPKPQGVPNYKDPDMWGVFEEVSLQIGNHVNWYDDAMTKKLLDGQLDTYAG